MAGGFNDYTGAGTGALITSASIVQPETAQQGDRISISSTAATADQLGAQYANMAPELRKALAVKLKAAGFKVPVTGKYSSTVRDKFIEASKLFSDEIGTVLRQAPQVIGNDVASLDSYLTSLAAERKGGESATQVYKTIYTDAKLGYLVDTVFSDLTGRKPTEDEKNYYIKTVQGIQRATPTAIVTQGDGFTNTSQGLGPTEIQQYLIDEIGGTDDAKRVKIQDGYQAVLDVLGVSL
jgi:hypothetical protein